MLLKKRRILFLVKGIKKFCWNSQRYISITGKIRKIMKYMSEKQTIYSAGPESITQKARGGADGERKCSGAGEAFILSVMNILINL